jgi:hypothetical protein
MHGDLLRRGKHSHNGRSPMDVSYHPEGRFALISNPWFF